MSHYRITPEQKKSIRNVYELSKEMPDGEKIWFNVVELYRSGVGFIKEEDIDSLPSEGDDIAYCNSNDGENESSDLDDSCSVEFEFCDGLSEEECAEIEELYYEGGAGWIYDGDHDWFVDNDYLEIDAPFKVELVDENGDQI